MSMSVKSHFSQHHFRMVHKILIHRHPIISIGDIHPILRCIWGQYPSLLLKEDNVGRNFGTRILFKGNSR